MINVDRRQSTIHYTMPVPIRKESHLAGQAWLMWNISGICGTFRSKFRSGGTMVEASLKKELESRIKALHVALSQAVPSFDTALVAGRVNQLYLANTMQDALFVLKRDGSAFLFVRRSFERAQDECPLDIVRPMSAYRDIASSISTDFGNTCIDMDVVTVSMLERLKKYFKMDQIRALDQVLLNLRAVKSPRELSAITRSGRLHRQLMEDMIPSLLREGMSEAEFHGEVLSAMMKMGFHGVPRFSMFQSEMIGGQLGFGENAVYPASFDGPGGMRGDGPAAPAAGSSCRKLRKGDLVFADIGFGLDGYHTDKTQVYSFGAPPAPDIDKMHRACLDIQKRCAERLVAGEIPSRIYADIMGHLPECLSQGFMGIGRSVNFIGHGIGLHINELPLISKGFDEPLAANMVIALEPKCGIPGVGTVGVEDTYVVKSGSSECVTGGGTGIIVV
jgi:Xaa-Pro dipeptidase